MRRGRSPPRRRSSDDGSLLEPEHVTRRSSAAARPAPFTAPAASCVVECSELAETLLGRPSEEGAERTSRWSAPALVERRRPPAAPPPWRAPAWSGPRSARPTTARFYKPPVAPAAPRPHTVAAQASAKTLSHAARALAAAAAERESQERFEARLAAVTHGMESHAGVNATLDAREAQHQLLRQQRQANTYQAWRAQVFEPLQAALQTRATAAVNVVNDPLKADLHAAAAERRVAVSLGLSVEPAFAAIRDTIAPEQFVHLKSTTGIGRWTDETGGLVPCVLPGASPLRHPFRATPLARQQEEEAAAPQRKLPPASHPIRTGEPSGDAWIEARPGQRHVPHRLPIMAPILRNAFVPVTPDGPPQQRIRAARAAAEAAQRATGTAGVASEDFGRRVQSVKVLVPPLLKEPVEGRRHLHSRGTSGVRGARRGMFEVLRDRVGGELDGPGLDN